MTDTEPDEPWALTMMACLTALINDGDDIAEQILADTEADDLRTIALEAMTEQAELLEEFWNRQPKCGDHEHVTFAEYWARGAIGDGP